MTFLIVRCGVPGCTMGLALDYDESMEPREALRERQWQVSRKVVIINGEFVTQEIPLCSVSHSSYTGPL